MAIFAFHPARSCNHHGPDTAQAGEQVRLGVRHDAGLTAIRSRVLQRLEVAESPYRPHITLGLARHDIPAAALIPMPLPPAVAAAASLELQQEVTATHFRVLARAVLDAPAGS